MNTNFRLSKGYFRIFFFSAFKNNLKILPAKNNDNKNKNFILFHYTYNYIILLTH
jgi:hypothetical protein